MTKAFYGTFYRPILTIPQPTASDFNSQQQIITHDQHCRFNFTFSDPFNYSTTEHYTVPLLLEGGG